MKKKKPIRESPKRSLEVREEKDGFYTFIGPSWDVDKISVKEADEFFSAWRTRKLKEVCSIKLKPPRILQKRK